MMKRVLCNATVDTDVDAVVVTVVGAGDHSGVTETYRFPLTETEDSAAMESVRRFVAANGGDL